MLKQGEIIDFYHMGVLYKATIQGVAIIEQAVIGKGYIVRPEQPIPNLQYNCIVVFESHIQGTKFYAF